MSMSQQRINFDRQALADLCRRHHIRRLLLFGSVLRDDFGPDSGLFLRGTEDDIAVPGQRTTTRGR